MANGHGGPRTPAKPAPVSGPGALSKRTDGGPGHPTQVLSAAPDQAYGEKKAQMDAQRLAPMGAATPPPPTPQPQSAPQGGGGGAMPQYSGAPLNAPSQRPSEPVTTGVDVGPGADSSALGILPNPAQGTGQMTALLQRLSSTDTTGILGQLMQAAQAKGA
jgi:hypothetical protein